MPLLGEKMIVFKAINKTLLYICICFAILVLIILALLRVLPISLKVMSTDDNLKWKNIIDKIFVTRNQSMLSCDLENLKDLYLVDERNGLWAYENEIRRANYLDGWAKKQCCSILDISSEFKINSIKQIGRGFSFYIIASTKYTYSYDGCPDIENFFHLGTHHSIDLIPKEDGFIISREWYADPLSCMLDTDKLSSDISEHIQSHEPKTNCTDNSKRIAAVEYADKFCGATSTSGYNSEYTNYNSLGGDCTNFVSQVLFEGGGFKKNSAWNYNNRKGSYIWIKAQALKDYLVYSGRASVIAKGSYTNVYKHAYSLMPGDIIAYTKKGKVAHLAVVTDFDSKGYPLVSCHNADRYHVPWDIGWRYNGTVFYLLCVHY